MTSKATSEELIKRIEALEKKLAENKRMSKRLRESEEQHRSLFETMTLGVVCQDMKKKGGYKNLNLVFSLKIGNL